MESMHQILNGGPVLWYSSCSSMMLPDLHPLTEQMPQTPYPSHPRCGNIRKGRQIALQTPWTSVFELSPLVFTNPLRTWKSPSFMGKSTISMVMFKFANCEKIIYQRLFRILSITSRVSTWTMDPWIQKIRPGAPGVVENKTSPLVIWRSEKENHHVINR